MTQNIDPLHYIQFFLDVLVHVLFRVGALHRKPPEE